MKITTYLFSESDNQPCTSAFFSEKRTPKMNKRFNVRDRSSFFKTALLGTALLAAFLSNRSFAQTTNASDTAADPAYAAFVGVQPNGLSPGGQNGGFGFGPWTFTVTGTGGAFIQTFGPSGDSFDLWNISAASTTIATRPFSAPLTPGQSFSVQLRLNSLDNSGTTNALMLQDSSGNTLFTYWHVGFEPNNAVNGHYTDGATTNGAAVNFRYDYQQFDSFTFTLNSSTTYTFTDNTTGATVSGVVSGSISQVTFFRGSAGATGNGQDFQFDNLMITSAAAAIPVHFTQVTPTPGSFSAPVTNSISAQIVPGSSGLNSTITMKVDGSTVTPTVTSGIGGVLNVTYQPPSPLSAGTKHTAELIASDSNNNHFTNDWSFTTGFASLPAVLPGPFAISSTNTDLLIFTSAGDPWLGTNYGANSTRTLYTRFSMAFHDLNGETGGGGGFGGLHFFQDNAEKLLIGNAWISLNWSIDATGTGYDLSPVTPIVLDEWHTMVARVDYSGGGNAAVKVWLDPDFTQTEANQPNAPLQITSDAAFNAVKLRCGNGTASANFSNIIVAATSAGVGFVAPSDPQFQGFVPSPNASSAAVNTPIGAEILFGSYGIGTNTVALTLDGTNVAPAFAVTPTSITVNYQPPTLFPAGSSHSVGLSLTDSNGTPFSTSWSFTVDSFPTLPVTVPGPIDVSGGGEGVLIFSNLNEWIGGNYQANSTNTLYARFSMTFFDLNGETTDDQGGCFGGFHFYQDDNEKLLVGETWLRNSWSVDTKAGGEGGEIAIPPVTTVVAGEWHTMVVKCVYASNAPTTVKVWLDPDFTKSEGAQPQSPLNVTMDNTFNDIRLRCGNGSAFAEYTNIVIAANASGVGFASAPAVLSIQNSVSGKQLSWSATGVLEEAQSLTGPWTSSANQSNPQILTLTNSARFFRLRQ